MQIEELGKPLDEIIKTQKEPFTVEKVSQLMLQLLWTLEEIHKKGIIHCNLSTQNLTMGVGSMSKYLYITNFRNAIEMEESEFPFEYIGDLNMFSSITLHRGEGISPKDDLISTTYIIIHLLTLNLPWSPSSNDLQLNESNIWNLDTSDLMKMRKLKTKTSIESLTSELFKNLDSLSPNYETNWLNLKIIKEYIQDVWSKKPEEKLNYSCLKAYFRSILSNANLLNR